MSLCKSQSRANREVNLENETVTEQKINRRSDARVEWTFSVPAEWSGELCITQEKQIT